MTVFPVLSFLDKINFRPAIIANCQGRKWKSLVSRSQEKLKVSVDGEEKSLTRYYCETKDGEFVLYSNPTSWMNSVIWKAELDSLARHLKSINPEKKYYLLCDNFRGHGAYDSPNLKTIFLPPQTTSVLQPADVCFNAVYKSKFQKNKKIILSDINRENMSLSLEEGVGLVVTTLNQIKQSVCDESFRRTGLQPFQIGYTPESDLMEITKDMADLQTDDADFKVRS